MVRMKAPEGATSISVGQQIYKVDNSGFVNVPEHFVKTLTDHAACKVDVGRVSLVGTNGQTADIAETLRSVQEPVKREILLPRQPVKPITEMTEEERIEQIKQDGIRALAEMAGERGLTDAALADAAKGASAEQTSSSTGGVVNTINSGQQETPGK